MERRKTRYFVPVVAAVGLAVAGVCAWFIFRPTPSVPTPDLREDTRTTPQEPSVSTRTPVAVAPPLSDPSFTDLSGGATSKVAAEVSLARGSTVAKVLLASAALCSEAARKVTFEALAIGDSPEDPKLASAVFRFSRNEVLYSKEPVLVACADAGATTGSPCSLTVYLEVALSQTTHADFGDQWSAQVLDQALNALRTDRIIDIYKLAPRELNPGLLGRPGAVAPARTNPAYPPDIVRPR